MIIFKRIISIISFVILILILLLALNEYGNADSTTFKKLNNIPLSLELQQYTYELCKKENISFNVFTALMWKESKFNSKAISRNGLDKGICQIRASSHKKLIKELKITNIMDAKQNIKLAVRLMSIYTKKYKNENYHIILMCYNMGEGGAKSMWKRGVYSTPYSRSIINYSKKLY